MHPPERIVAVDPWSKLRSSGFVVAQGAVKRDNPPAVRVR